MRLWEGTGRDEDLGGDIRKDDSLGRDRNGWRSERGQKERKVWEGTARDADLERDRKAWGSAKGQHRMRLWEGTGKDEDMGRNRKG